MNGADFIIYHHGQVVTKPETAIRSRSSCRAITVNTAEIDVSLVL